MTIVAAVQAAPVFLDREATVAKVGGLAREASEVGAELIVFPETFVPTYPDWVWRAAAWDAPFEALTAALTDQAVEVPSAATVALGAAAKAANAYVSVGVNERDGGSLYNTQLLFAPNGSLVGRHRKLVPTGGERLVWGMGTLRHIAREGRCYVIGACMILRGSDVPDDAPGRSLWGDEEDWANDGWSAIVDPDGELMAGPLVAEEGILYAEIDAARLHAERSKFDPVGHYARPDVFRLVLDESPKRTVEPG
jgi:nitrilase